MKWTELNSEQQIEEIKRESKSQPVLIFKHSTRCSISGTALSRLERNWKEGEVAPIKMYYLDLLSYRNISQSVAESFNVEHESPQVLILKDGNPIYVRSHLAIGYDEIQQLLPSKN
ncbi:MAG TPA: bacillithiol system redox-active protein YtxJ [Cyclobacteriaceae bacterium]|jgi:bacillithiol system protein YtxJ|nr:bacillithiol system redox-active protein YtxJ [Cyclobacteriaceae bacterium]